MARSVWEQLDTWPTGADGEVCHASAARFCRERIDKLTPPVQAASDLIRRDYEQMEQTVELFLEHLGPEHPALILMNFALGVVDLADASFGLNAALREIALRASANAQGQWLPPPNHPEQPEVDG